MEFAVEFATFCNICFRNEGLRKIQESEPLLKVLTLLIENKAIIKRHEIYLCLTCCEKLESYDHFKEMCLRNFLDFRVEYFALKKELEICNNPDIEKKLRNFIESKIYEKSNSFNIYDLEGSTKLGNNAASTQSSDKSCVEKRLTDFYNVACKTEKVDSEYKEEYKLHTESDVENSDDNSELPVPIEHIKLETCADDTGESESSVRNENRTPLQSREIFGGEKEFHTTSDLLQYNNPAQTSNLDTQSINLESRENECNVCGKTFVTIRNLKIHMRIHTGEKPFTCTICNKSFTQSYSLKEHQVTHTGEKRYSCNVCNKTYSQLGTLKTHQRVHTGIKPHICNICNKAFTLSTRLKKHMLIHTGDKPHACPICKKDFRTSGNLRRHERVHTGEKPYACSMCDKKFTGSGNLKVHERVHTGERPYVCRTCHKAFNHINHLKAHERLHIDEKPYYECKVCNERFTQINSFRMHKATHTGKKPRTCGICKKVFTQTSALKEHERIHTGVKPYSCEICKKTFRRLGNLREHERIHTGVKPYTCKICKKSFRQRCQFRLHEQKQCIKQEVEDTLTEQSAHLQEIT